MRARRDRARPGARRCALPELRGERRQDLALRIAELEQLRPGVAAAGERRACPTARAAPDEEIVRHALERLEAALRARTAAGSSAELMMDPTTTAIGTWSGGRFMHFGEPLDDERLTALLRPGEGIDTVITADAYGAGEADRLLGRALAGRGPRQLLPGRRDRARLLRGRARRRQGLSPLHRPAHCASQATTRDYIRMATERSLERCGVEHFDLLLLHNPDRIGYSSPAVWDGMRGAPRGGPHAHARRRARPGQRLHARPDRLPRALLRRTSTGR